MKSTVFFKFFCFTLSWLPLVSWGNVVCIKTEFCASVVCPEVPKLADSALSVRAVCSNTSTWSFASFAALPVKLKHWDGSTCLQGVILPTLQPSVTLENVTLVLFSSFNKVFNIYLMNYYFLKFVYLFIKSWTLLRSRADPLWSNQALMFSKITVCL